jgi:hypothetical protein
MEAKFNFDLFVFSKFLDQGHFKMVKILKGKVARLKFSSIKWN